MSLNQTALVSPVWRQPWPPGLGRLQTRGPRWCRGRTAGSPQSRWSGSGWRTAGGWPAGQIPRGHSPALRVEDSHWSRDSALIGWAYCAGMIKVAHAQKRSIMGALLCNKDTPPRGGILCLSLASATSKFPTGLISDSTLPEVWPGPATATLGPLRSASSSLQSSSAGPAHRTRWTSEADLRAGNSPAHRNTLHTFKRNSNWFPNIWWESSNLLKEIDCNLRDGMNNSALHDFQEIVHVFY